MKTSATTLTALIAVLSCAACGDDDDEFTTPAEADLAVDTANAGDWDDAAMYAMTDPLEDPFFFDDGLALTVSTEAPIDDPERAATLVADNRDMYFTPAGCSDSEIDGGQLTLTLSNCTGPLGMRTVNGTIIADYSNSDGAIQVDLTSRNLTVDGASVVLDSTGVYSRSDSGEKMVEMTSRGSLTTRNGAELARDVQGTLAWTPGSQCVTIDHTGQITANARTFDVDVAGYQRCAGECPSAGSVSLTGDTSESVTLTFDGSDQPDFEMSNGDTGDVSLRCGT